MAEPCLSLHGPVGMKVVAFGTLIYRVKSMKDACWFLQRGGDTPRLYFLSRKVSVSPWASGSPGRDGVFWARFSSRVSNGRMACGPFSLPSGVPNFSHDCPWSVKSDGRKFPVHRRKICSGKGTTLISHLLGTSA